MFVIYHQPVIRVPPGFAKSDRGGHGVPMGAIGLHCRHHGVQGGLVRRPQRAVVDAEGLTLQHLPMSSLQRHHCGRAFTDNVSPSIRHDKHGASADGGHSIVGDFSGGRESVVQFGGCEDAVGHHVDSRGHGERDAAV